jgi:hypothetical protein
MASLDLRTADLTAVIGDNGAEGIHRAGYNGIWSLKHRTGTRNLFVPTVCGLNLEHIFDGFTDDNAVDVFFEPRHAPMELRRVAGNSAELHQPPTPTFHLESWTQFTVVEPHYIDFHFRCKPRQHVFKQGWIGLFWASYINAPEDKSIYFVGSGPQGKGNWAQYCTQFHNDQSTVLPAGASQDLKFRDGNRPSLFRNFSQLRFDQPLYYGNFEDHIWMLMFDRSDGIRFSHSPSGGGSNSERKTTNPAWDFQFIIPRYEVNQEYGFRARALFRPRCSREELLQEYRTWEAAKP